MMFKEMVRKTPKRLEDGWERWFAWRPVRVYSGRFEEENYCIHYYRRVWWQWIERRTVSLGYGDFANEYRLIKC